MTEHPNEGWHRPGNSRKWHYYRDYRSLCGATLMFFSGPFEQGQDDSPDNCAACRRKREKELET